MKVDATGNDVKPDSFQQLRWQTLELTDPSSYAPGSMRIALDEGRQAITFTLASNNIAIASIRLKPMMEYISYEE